MALHLNPNECDVDNYTTLPFLLPYSHPKREKWGFDKGWWHARRPQHMYQVLHFPDRGDMIVDPHYKVPIDVITCPKNCSSSLKEIWGNISFKNYSRKNNLGPEIRMKSYEKYNVTANNPWRKGSIRIAIKRDPVERAFSAATHILHYRYGFNYIAADIYERFFFGVNHTLRYDPHLIPQHRFYGKSIDFYDEIYYVKDFKQLAANIEATYPYHEYNPNTKMPMQEVKQTVGHYSQTTINDLSQECINRIQWLYRYDYEYGWY